MNNKSNTNKLRNYFIFRIFLNMFVLVFLLYHMTNITSGEIVSSTETGIVLEVFPIPGETCKEGELFVKVQLRDSIITLTDVKDWYTLYDKVGKEVDITCTVYTFKDGTNEVFYHAK